MATLESECEVISKRTGFARSLVMRSLIISYASERVLVFANLVSDMSVNCTEAAIKVSNSSRSTFSLRSTLLLRKLTKQIL